MRRLFARQRLGIATRHLGWVALGFFGMLLLLAMLLARIGANRLLDAVRWYGTLTSAERSIGWDGRITLDDAEFIPYGVGAAGKLQARRVFIETGGPVWLMRLALRRTSADRLERRRQELEASGALEKGETPPVLPPAGRLVINAENVTMGPDAVIARWVPWLDPSSGVLFAALGCRDAAGLSHAVALRTGDSGKFDVRLELRQRRKTADVAASFKLGGISSAEWHGKFQPASDLGLLAGDWRQWQMLEQQWTLRDRHFVRARNRECARRLALGRPQFVAGHALAVKRQLAAWKVALPAPLEHAYREHASVGGDIVFVSRPRQPIRLGEYQLMSRSQKIGALEGEVTIAGRRLRMLLEFLPEALATRAPDVPPAGVARAGKPASANVAATSPSAPAASMRDPAVAVATNARSTTSAAPHSMSKSVAPAATAAAVRPGQLGAGVSAAAVTGQPRAVTGSASVVASPRAGSSASAILMPDVQGVSSSSSAAPAGTAPAVASATLPSQGNYRGLIGRRVTITTTHGTSRTGKIRIANNVAVTLELQTQNGPIQLRIPAEQIVRVRTAPL